MLAVGDREDMALEECCLEELRVGLEAAPQFRRQRGGGGRARAGPRDERGEIVPPLPRLHRHPASCSAGTWRPVRGAGTWRPTVHGSRGRMPRRCGVGRVGGSWVTSELMDLDYV